jgi:hypothetical protein
MAMRRSRILELQFLQGFSVKDAAAQPGVSVANAKVSASVNREGLASPKRGTCRPVTGSGGGMAAISSAVGTCGARRTAIVGGPGGGPASVGIVGASE